MVSSVEGRAGHHSAVPAGPLSDVFGFTVEDIQSSGSPSLSRSGDKAGELWRCLIPSETSGATLRGIDGRPVAVEHHFGPGPRHLLRHRADLRLPAPRRSARRQLDRRARPRSLARSVRPPRRTRRPRRFPRPSGFRPFRRLPQQLGPGHPRHRPTSLLRPAPSWTSSPPPPSPSALPAHLPK